MSNKVESIGSGDLLNSIPLEVEVLGGDGLALDAGLVIRSEVVNWDDVIVMGSIDDCDDHSRPIQSCDEICYR